MAAALGVVALVGGVQFYLSSGNNPAPETPPDSQVLPSRVEAAAPEAALDPQTAAPLVQQTVAVATGATPAAAPAVAPAAAARPRPAAAPAPEPRNAPASAAATAPAPADPMAEVVRVARAKFDAKLLDQALGDLRTVVAQGAATASAPAAYLLMGTIYEQQGRADDAMAAYVELRSKYPSSDTVAEATFRLADSLLRSKRADRETSALALFSEIDTAHAGSPWAPRALTRKAAIEERTKRSVVDPQLGRSVPAELISYRRLAEQYPDAPDTEMALTKLSELYDELRRYELAAEALHTLAARFPANSRDAAWRAGEIYERRLKDIERARASYALVPQRSSRYRDAQEKIAELK
jgi:TolA-binding protein